MLFLCNEKQNLDAGNMTIAICISGKSQLFASYSTPSSSSQQYSSEMLKSRNSKLMISLRDLPINEIKWLNLYTLLEPRTQ